MDELAAEVAALDIAQGPHHLVVDGLNYLHFFVPVSEPSFAKAKPWDLIAELRKRVAAFLRGCKRSGFQPHFVIDTGFQSDEASEKWMSRREQEVKDEWRAMPCSADVVLAAELRAQGADVLQPLGLDADDVVARLALHWQGTILSEDRDMLRYTDLPDGKKRIAHMFAFGPSGGLELAMRSDFKCQAEPRQACSTDLALKEWRQPKVKTITVDAATSMRVYKRGNADSFTRKTGNLIGHARPLRKALYARLGYDAVLEIFPEWDSKTQSVIWRQDRVEADSSLDALLSTPKEALEWLVASDSTPVPRNHKHCQAWRAYAQAMLVAEYCQHACDAGPKEKGDSKLQLAGMLSIARALDPNSSSAPQGLATADADARWDPPTHMRAKTCGRQGCRGLANCGYGELQYLWSKGFKEPTLCKLCRLSRPKRNSRP